jgi:hypothetical protein
MTNSELMLAAVCGDLYLTADRLARSGIDLPAAEKGLDPASDRAAALVRVEQDQRAWQDHLLAEMTRYCPKP